MHTLANLFVSLVTLANTIAPNAHLPQVLGVETSASNSSSIASSSGALRKNIDQRTQVREKATSDFQAKLKTIKDERKQQTVTKLNETITTRNSEWHKHWTEVLTRLNDILAKIKTKRDALQTAGKDVAALNVAISDAQTAISQAQVAIDAQAAKNYTFTITTEEELKNTITSTLATFKTDVTTVITALNRARESIAKAYQALVAIPGNREKEASRSGLIKPVE